MLYSVPVSYIICSSSYKQPFPHKHLFCPSMCLNKNCGQKAKSPVLENTKLLLFFIVTKWWHWRLLPKSHLTESFTTFKISCWFYVLSTQKTAALSRSKHAVLQDRERELLNITARRLLLLLSCMIYSLQIARKLLHKRFRLSEFSLCSVFESIN